MLISQPVSLYNGKLSIRIQMHRALHNQTLKKEKKIAQKISLRCYNFTQWGVLHCVL